MAISFIVEYMLKKRFNVSVIVVFAFLVHGASDVGTDVSVHEGDSVTLHTNIKVTQQDRIRWYFNGTHIAQIIGNISRCTDVQCEHADERFRDRLTLDNQTGSLTISNARTTDTGPYKVTINSKTEKTFNVSIYAVPVPADERGKIKNSGLSPAAIAGICVALSGLLAAALGVTYYCRKNNRKEKGSSHNQRGSQHRVGANGRPPQMGCLAPRFQPLAESESETE
ncbi:carcinoembryonic antigen-related cell adhesion molecule 1-like [Labeo rohita]|uniref:carcinoembryonic antigen-related cell adhesion molecule 1-like n=1 Tax=Labeo rohita TaxID=84645 RepID=UPI0021E1DD46|nr:carcinoembryonic antigen-related cell adhesion molecule 1-like [Labeo rohita]